MAKAPRHVLSELLMPRECDGVDVTMEGVQDKPRARSLGDPNLTPFKTNDFGTIFSYRMTDDQRINLREARTIVFYLQWLLRAVGRRSKRVILFVDSKVAVGAMQKGRSGSAALNALVRKAHCLCMAGGLRLHIVFIPTEHNPADFPSRGEAIPGRRRVRRRRRGRSVVARRSRRCRRSRRFRRSRRSRGSRRARRSRRSRVPVPSPPPCPSCRHRPRPPWVPSRRRP